MVTSLSQGCFRALTGFPNSHLPCYASDENPWEGCYANHTRHALCKRNKSFNVIDNGTTEENAAYFNVRLPSNGFSLARYRMPNWRVDSETSCGSLSLAAEIIHEWAEANPEKSFTTISSGYFFVPAASLRRAAKAGNIVVGHTLSPWFSEEELRSRVRQLDKCLTYGVPSVIWAATRPEWENPAYDSILSEALKLVPAEAVIEVPYHERGSQSDHTMGVNPLGGCCEHKMVKKGVKYGRCVVKGSGACRLACGATFLRRLRRAA